MTRSTDDSPPEMMDLFSIDEVMYQVPAKPRVNIALKYLDNLRRMGPVIADMMLLEELIGTEAYQALSNYEDLKGSDLKTITDTVVRLTLGAMEDEDDADADESGAAKAKQNGGRRRRGNGTTGRTKSGG